METTRTAFEAANQPPPDVGEPLAYVLKVDGEKAIPVGWVVSSQGEIRLIRNQLPASQRYDDAFRRVDEALLRGEKLVWFDFTPVSVDGRAATIFMQLQAIDLRLQQESGSATRCRLVTPSPEMQRQFADTEVPEPDFTQP